MDFPVWLLHQGQHELSFDDEYFRSSTFVSADWRFYPVVLQIVYSTTDWVRTSCIADNRNHEDPDCDSLTVKKNDVN